jgi:hypothetical protein
MAKSTITPENAQLLDSISTLLADAENNITLPMTAINQGIAQLSVQNAKALTKIQGALIKSIEQHAVTNDNAIDQLGMAILAPMQGWQEENNLLLTQLAASAGLTQPGDPLEAALVAQVADEPELAYSATLLIALRDALPHLAELVEVLREIRDRMPPTAIRNVGEQPAAGEDDEQVGGDDPDYASFGTPVEAVVDWPIED